MTTFLFIQDWGWGERTLTFINCKRADLENEMKAARANEDYYGGKPRLDSDVPITHVYAIAEDVRPTIEPTLLGGFDQEDEVVEEAIPDDRNHDEVKGMSGAVPPLLPIAPCVRMYRPTSDGRPREDER